MPAFHVQRNIVIRAPAEKVFDTVADYSTWTTWSPWLGADKDATVNVSDDSTLAAFKVQLVGRDRWRR